MYFIEKTKESDYVRRFDYLLFVPIFALCAIGLLAVRSAVLSRADGGARIMTMQLIGLLIGFIMCFILTRIDYKDLKNTAFILHTFSIALLGLVLIGGTGDDLGSRSWLNFSGISFQPSEISKVTFIIILALYLEKLTEAEKNREGIIARAIFFCSIPVLLIIAQKDFGTSMVFFFILTVMLLAYGIPYRYFVIFGGVALTTMVVMYFVPGLMNQARKKRITVFFNPEFEPYGAGLNVATSKMAIGSGMITGTGVFQGPQTQNSSVPVKESDFIFSVIGEELGFMGTMLVIFLIVVLLLRCTYIAYHARDFFGSYVSVGICAMFAIHFLENIGMTIGLMPVTGIPLPFISAGGSSMVATLVAVGILMSISIRQKKIMFMK